MLRSATHPFKENVQYIELNEVSETGVPYKVWTKTIGQGQTKLLVLSGGPGFSHDYLTAFAEKLPLNKMTLIFYDQLGTGNSQRELTDEKLWTLERYREEIEQVRKGLGLDKIVLCGHSWGGMLAIEYALKYPEHLQGLIISSMSASVPSFIQSYRKFREMLEASDLEMLIQLENEQNFDDPRYQELIMKINKEHVCRTELPEYAIKSLIGMNRSIYATMMGKNEFSPEGNLKDWDRWNDLSAIRTKTLLSVGRYDMMAVDDIEKMQTLMNATLSICENGGHLSMIDDAENYFKGIIDFVNEIKRQHTPSMCQNSKSNLFSAQTKKEKVDEEKFLHKKYVK